MKTVLIAGRELFSMTFAGESEWGHRNCKHETGGESSGFPDLLAVETD